MHIGSKPLVIIIIIIIIIIITIYLMSAAQVIRAVEDNV